MMPPVSQGHKTVKAHFSRPPSSLVFLNAGTWNIFAFLGFAKPSFTHLVGASTLVVYSGTDTLWGNGREEGRKESNTDVGSSS